MIRRIKKINWREKLKKLVNITLVNNITTISRYFGLNRKKKKIRKTIIKA